MDSFIKQPSEEFVIGVNFGNVLATAETIVLATSSVLAVDQDGTAVSSTVLNQGTKALDSTSKKLRMRCRSGDSTGSPYVITFKAVTSDNNIWELSIQMAVYEIA